MQILQLDIQGYPQNWISPQQAASYYATDSVAWTVGEVCQTLRGGTNAHSGLQSRLDSIRYWRSMAPARPTSLMWFRRCRMPNYSSVIGINVPTAAPVTVPPVLD